MQSTRKRSPARLVTLIALVAIVLVVLGAGAYFFLLKPSTSTANNGPTPTPFTGLYQASLTSNPGNWSCKPGNACSFQDDGEHIKATQKDTTSESLYLKQTFGDIVLEVKGTLIKGDARDAGLVIEFRIPQQSKAAGYGFIIYDDGTYSVLKWDAQGNYSALVDTTSSSAIHQQLKQANDLKIVISGSHFTFYDNGQQLIDTSDSDYTSGYIGLAAAGPGTEAVFSQLTITKP
jgi:hypothetical protein